MLWNSGNDLREFVALGKAVGIKDIRSGYWLKLAEIEKDKAQKSLFLLPRINSENGMS